MQKFYALLILFWMSVTLVCAQSNRNALPTDTIRQQLEHLLAPLDKSQVPTGLLAEYATPLMTLSRFSAPTLADSNRADMDTWRHLYATLRTARVQGSDTLPSIHTLNARIRAAEAASPAIPLAVQYGSYASLRPEAESAGLVYWQNEQLYDVPGRTQSPYQAQAVFAAAPSLSYSATGSVSFVPRRNLYVANNIPRSNNVSLGLDFDDGRGYVAAPWN